MIEDVRFPHADRAPRVLDANERAALQQEWFGHLCPHCGRWHAGDGVCPRVKSYTRARTTATIVTETFDYWQDGEYREREDDFTWDEVWGSAHIVAFQAAEAAETEKRSKKDEEKKGK